MSLLYLNENEKTTDLYSDSYKDLAIEELVHSISTNDTEYSQMKKILTVIPTDPNTILYRQSILQDFMENEVLRTKLLHIVKKLNVLSDLNYTTRFGEQKSSVWQMINQLKDIELYAEVVEEIDTIFEENPPKSEGLSEIAQKIHGIMEGEEIHRLKQDLKRMRTELSDTKALTLGVNLTPDLMPKEVYLLEFRQQPHKEPINKVIEFVRVIKQLPAHELPSHLMMALTQEVEKHLSGIARDMRKTLKKYMNLDSYFLKELRDEILYYVRLATFGCKLQEKGYPICYPKIVKNTNDIHIKEAYNIRLALKDEPNIVTNDFDFLAKERIFILTGPNRGGKTVLTQGVGLIAYMAALGMFVCATSYEGFCIKQIFTHFPADENQTISYGRLGEEAVRIQNIVRQADASSLILLNETYSSTCASDGLYLAKDLLHILKEKGVRVIYNTHIHELAFATEEMNKWEGTSDIISTIMEIIDNKNTFRMLRSKPDICSYAKNLAIKYGVTYEQMKGEEDEREKEVS